MNNVQFKYFDFNKIKEIIKNYILEKAESKKFKGLPSFDKPWEKWAFLVPKKIKIPTVPYALLALNEAERIDFKRILIYLNENFS